MSTCDGKTATGFYRGQLRHQQPFPHDLDVFLLMQVGFDREFPGLPPPQREVFEHESARLLFEADVFWEFVIAMPDTACIRVRCPFT